MPRQVRKVTDMEIDEISLVDRPANAHATVRIAKRASQEGAVPPPEDEIDEIFDETGEQVDIGDLQFGDVVYDRSGQAYEYGPVEGEEGGADAEDPARAEPVGVGKRYAGDAFGAPATQATQARTSFADEVREQLAKAVSDADRDEVFAKALDALSKADERAAAAEEIAKAERGLRLEREYIAKAAQYNMPIPAEDLGPVLMRAAEALSFDDCAVLHKALSAAGEMLFTEAGFAGESDNDDPMTQIDAHLEREAARVSKNGDQPVSKAQVVTDFFADNPAAYDEYLASRNNR